jgi:hypothetical protein
VGIYWNKDVETEGQDQPRRAAKRKSAADKPGPSVREARTWTSAPTAEDSPSDPDPANEPLSRKR